MKLIIAPDSYKGTNTGIRVSHLIKKGVLKVFPEAEIICIPVADGGEGTVETVLAARKGTLKRRLVTGPLGEKHEAFLGFLEDEVPTAVIEMAAASGLPLIPREKRNPLRAGSGGTGELIRYALESGCRKIILGVGGSATNDGGMGMAQALGYRFLDKKGRPLPPRAEALADLDRIDGSSRHPLLEQCRLIIACDVSNPLLGPRGASRVYGPQKGATPEMTEILDRSLVRLAECVKRDLQKDEQNTPGAGGGGGMGYGLTVFCGGTIQSGINTMLDMARFDQHLNGTDLVLTGEGKFDGQSAYGKVPVGIADRVCSFSRKKGVSVPVIALVGDIGEDVESASAYGLDGLVSTVSRAMPLEEALEKSGELLEQAAERTMELLKAGMRLSPDQTGSPSRNRPAHS